MLDTHALTSTDYLDWERFFSEKLPLKHYPHLIVLGPAIGKLQQYTGMPEITYINSPITGKKLRAALHAAQNTGNTSPTPDLQDLSDQMKKTLIEAPCPGLESKTVTKENDSFMSTSSTSEEQQKKVPQHPPFIRHVSIPTVTSPASTSRFKRFLLVDDNPINLKVLAAFITRIGRPFSTASDGAEAVQLYRDAALGDEISYDCIFMDISMPIMDGFQAISEIRRFEKQISNVQTNASSDIPHQSYIMALTGLGSDEARRAARDSGVDGFLLKPIKFKDVLPLL
jgi:CheY-like chemotaxis protein